MTVSRTTNRAADHLSTRGAVLAWITDMKLLVAMSTDMSLQDQISTVRPRVFSFGSIMTILAQCYPVLNSIAQFWMFGIRTLMMYLLLAMGRCHPAMLFCRLFPRCYLIFDRLDWLYSSCQGRSYLPFCFIGENTSEAILVTSLRSGDFITCSWPIDRITFTGVTVSLATGNSTELAGSRHSSSNRLTTLQTGNRTYAIHHSMLSFWFEFHPKYTIVR
jgi:hypothetical protein